MAKLAVELTGADTSLAELVQKLGSLPLDTFVPEQLRHNRLELPPITLEHTFEVARRPLHHRDPFDRMLIARSIREGIPTVSADEAFDAYPVQRHG